MDTYPYFAAADILSTAAEYVRSGWVQDMLAADEQMRPVDFVSDKARYWCATGAMRLAARDHDTNAFQAAIQALKLTVGAAWVANWNNALGRTGEQIATIMDQVATTLREEGKVATNAIRMSFAE